MVLKKDSMLTAISCITVSGTSAVGSNYDINNVVQLDSLANRDSRIINYLDAHT
jgi:hypothetical protein